jgi:hypothetical protein
MAPIQITRPRAGPASRVTIEQAKGKLAERLTIDMEDAR